MHECYKHHTACSPPLTKFGTGFRFGSLPWIPRRRALNLSVVPENEPLDSDTEAENNLVERIKSIKQEKEDLACRLPEMEQPGSDQENLDSEASLSSESLLDEQQRSSVPSSELEGQY
ncbi:unconventional myosin-IXb-like [Thalassophryne amazonica]|uniref:unconventional myosin-IXb-like n=1 Tax=Thalassophryne amazonica TaxID=390379 RepID=UPI001470CF42|nr:unconventional myosin-IXb-like [Thalassophryne amazonica]